MPILGVLGDNKKSVVFSSVSPPKLEGLLPGSGDIGGLIVKLFVLRASIKCGCLIAVNF